MKRIDWKLATLVIVLSLFGIIMIYSASSYSALKDYGDAFFYVKKQVLAFFLGIIVMFALIFVNIEKIKRFAVPVYAVSMLLLALVFVPGLGVESYGAKRWLDLGFFTLQPSEYSKFGLVIFLAAFMSSRDITKLKNLALALACGLAMSALIIAEPNMSITVCVGAVLIIMLFVGGMKTRHLAALALPAAAAVPVMIIAEPYRLKRLAAFIDPWKNPLGEGYQLIQSYYALGSGGFFGVGLFNSRQKYLFLPFAESDFILSVIGEELGYAGCLLLFALFAALIYLGYAAAVRADTPFKCYLAAGITSVIAVQTLVNAAVVSGAIPPTGLPLPFISAGGSSLVAFMAACGLLLNVSARGATHKQEKNHSM